MKNVKKTKAVYKAFNIVSLASLVVYFTMAGILIAPRSVNSITVGPCPDFNGDNWVNLSDFAYLGSAYGKSVGDPEFNAQADFDQDGDIDETDKIIFSIYYNGPFTCGQDYLVNINDMLCPDFNGDGKVNLSDFAFFGQYLNENNTVMADFDSDGDVDEDDLAIFGIFYNTDYDCGGPTNLTLAPMSIAPVLIAPISVCFPNFIESPASPNQVNLSDFSAFGAHYNSSQGDANYDSLYDVNSDGKIDDYDKSVFEVYYNQPFTCGSNFVCGNGVVESGESCDDANIQGGDGCSASCQAEMGYTCSGAPSACMTVCGDAIKAGAEACDEGKNNTDTACVAGYNQTCTYCTASCVEMTVMGPKEAASIVPDTVAKLTLIKSVESGSYYPGSPVNFIVTIKNEGTAIAKNVRLADTMPAGFAYDDGSQGSWFFSDLKIGQEMNHIYSVTIGSEVSPGSYTNTVQVSADNVPAVTATANLVVIAKPGVVLGAETEGTVEAAEEKSLPKAGSDLFFGIAYLLSVCLAVFSLKKLN